MTITPGIVNDQKNSDLQPSQNILKEGGKQDKVENFDVEMDVDVNEDAAGDQEDDEGTILWDCENLDTF